MLPKKAILFVLSLIMLGNFVFSLSCSIKSLQATNILPGGSSEITVKTTGTSDNILVRIWNSNQELVESTTISTLVYNPIDWTASPIGASGTFIVKASGDCGEKFTSFTVKKTVTNIPETGIVLTVLVSLAVLFFVSKNQT